MQDVNPAVTRLIREWDLREAAFPLRFHLDSYTGPGVDPSAPSPRFSGQGWVTSAPLTKHQASAPVRDEAHRPAAVLDHEALAMPRPGPRSAGGRNTNGSQTTLRRRLCRSRGKGAAVKERKEGERKLSDTLSPGAASLPTRVLPS